MLRFFRSIRKRLLNTGKFRSYLIYALGEILLVMIGILLALQVNNWNEGQKRKKLEHKMITQIQEEIGIMLSDLGNDLAVLNQGMESHMLIDDYLQQDLPYSDSLCFAFYWLNRDEYLYPIKTGYEVLKTEGLDIIQNDSIRGLLQSCYEFIFPRISKQEAFYPDIEATLNPFYELHFAPNRDSSLFYKLKLTEEVTFELPVERTIAGRTSIVTIGFVPNDFEALKKNTQFQMLLKRTVRYRAYKLSRYESSIDMVKTLLQLIDAELSGG